MGAMRRAGVWLGLIEDDEDRGYAERGYDDDDFEDEVDEAPARLIAVRCSTATVSWSIHPFAAAAFLPGRAKQQPCSLVSVDQITVAAVGFRAMRFRCAHVSRRIRRPIPRQRSYQRRSAWLSGN